MKHQKQTERRDFLKHFGAAVVAGTLGGLHGPGNAIAPSADKRPNIVLVLADDMGYSDIGCYGSEIHTPVLDRLAKEGLQFTQAYNTARCCPSRASLLTGLYAHQTGIGHMTTEDEHNFDYGLPGYRGVLNRNCVTIAEALRPAGYHTWMTGKWHVGTERGNWPLDRGFDRYYGIIRGGSNYFKPAPETRLASDNELVPEVPEDFYTTDAFTDNAIRFIEEQNDERPFFLYLAYNAPHWPLHAPKEEIEKYRGNYLKGWDALREERYARQQASGLIDTRWKLTERDLDVPAWDTLPQERKEDLDYRMAIYAAQVDRMDQNIGRLVASLEKAGKMDNTLLLFLSDNGGCAEGGKFGGGPSEQLGTKEGYFLTYGQGWANASNTPFRRYKHWVHEGGIAPPFIAHWPKGIAERAGTRVNQPLHIIDLMPTCLELAGADYPKEYEGNTIPSMAGKSIMPLLRDGDKPIHDALYWEHEGNCAVRRGDWKVVSAYSEKERKWEFYNLKEDRTETNDLSEKQPEILAALINDYKNWASIHQVEPWPIDRD